MEIFRQPFPPNLWPLGAGNKTKENNYMAKSNKCIDDKQHDEVPVNAAGTKLCVKKKRKLNVAKKAQALRKLNFKFIKVTARVRGEMALMLGETIGLTESQKNIGVIRENIAQVAPIWMRQCNRLDKGKTDTKTIGKRLGIDGTPREVLDRLWLFKFYHSQYEIICELCLSSYRLSAAFE